ncbi:DNA cytosine methyltransferase [Streptomyces sp. NBC_00078]|uniref:DNA cytosine methyltransferase n=1 Tax=unclassified Streptomyces TaxID=2593676 RepID=UPI0022534FFA|nr:DNA cytosine methyltransferase [Streptomyces sp. NBC_00078]MCX5420883.1 DNA cytosine methyltransferase [Streptomyces sp. NBC_00078]
MAATDLPIGSLFSGVGGLDLGVQAALGGHIAWHAESDPRAAQVLARHWPRVPNLGDVRAIDWQRTEPVCVRRSHTPRGAEEHGLDDAAETERPWSTAAVDAPPGTVHQTELTHRGTTSKVTVRYVVVDGPDGQALAERQAAAIRHALAWLAAHPDHVSSPTQCHDRSGEGAA